MATTYKQQDYQLGVPFNAYALSDFMADSQFSADWTWNHRTLSGFRDENGTFVPFGGELQYDTDKANLSGVWTLDKDRFVCVYLNGDPGKLSVRVRGQTNDSKPFPVSATAIDETVTETTQVPLFFYSYISVDIIPAEGYAVKKLEANHGVWYSSISGSANAMANKPIDASMLFEAGSGNNGKQYWSVSVDYVAGGVLEYVSNKEKFDPYQA